MSHFALDYFNADTSLARVSNLDRNIWPLGKFDNFQSAMYLLRLACDNMRTDNYYVCPIAGPLWCRGENCGQNVSLKYLCPDLHLHTFLLRVAQNARSPLQAASDGPSCIVFTLREAEYVPNHCLSQGGRRFTEWTFLSRFSSQCQTPRPKSSRCFGSWTVQKMLWSSKFHYRPPLVQASGCVCFCLLLFLSANINIYRAHAGCCKNSKNLLTSYKWAHN